MEEKNVNLDLDTEMPYVEVKPVQTQKTTKSKQAKERSSGETTNCLRNERIIVRHVKKPSPLVKDPNHVLYGGMSDRTVRTFVVPRLSSGILVNVLTDAEKDFLEDVMGLEYNALSIYKKVDNFWDDDSNNGISQVRLRKQDNYLDLSNPEDYIKYKILLANKDFIAPSLTALKNTPKATYQFVIISEGEEAKVAKNNMTTTMTCYKEYGKIENDIDTLRVIIESIDGRPTASNTKLEFLQSKINDMIQNNSSLFLKTVQDPLLPTKVLIKKSLEIGSIYKKGNYLYLADGGTPLCDKNEEPNINNAARYLNKPKYQNIKFALEAKLK